jgi:hypothetical protein
MEVLQRQVIGNPILQKVKKGFGRCYKAWEEMNSFAQTRR